MHLFAASSQNSATQLIELARTHGVVPHVLEDENMCCVSSPVVAGLSGFTAKTCDTIVTGYGDRLHINAPFPNGSDPMSWISWTSRCFARFGGAILSGDRVVLWTDATAGCPVFYALTENGGLLFASEAKLLFALLPHSVTIALAPDVRPVPPRGRSAFRGIDSVPPGECVSIRRDCGIWTIESSVPFFHLPKEPVLEEEGRAVIAVKDCLEKGVAKLVGGLTEVGLTLSGGVDSTSVGALVRDAGVRVKSYTVGSTFGDEYAAARDSAEVIGSEHHELQMNAGDLAELLPKLIWDMETWDPITLQIAAPAAFLYHQAQSLRAPDIFLTGYGADLIFAGVGDSDLSEENLENAVFRNIAATVPTNEFSPTFAARRGITVRYPFWTPEMLSLGLSIRGRLKILDGHKKYVFRRSMETVVPHHVAWRPKIGIHEGSMMARLFSEVLETESKDAQAQKLRAMAERMFEAGAEAHAPVVSVDTFSENPVIS